jgi:hypothetical protein
MEEKTTKKDQTHKKHYRGWLPKEPKPLQPQSNQKTTTTISTKTTGGLATGTLILGFFLLVGPYYLFPELYVPKTNPSWGYTTANSIAGWTFTAGGIGLMLLSISLFTLYAVKLGEKNPAWMNHNWITPRYTNTFGKKIYISTIAINSLMITTFLAITILTSGTTTPVIITFTVLMNIVNLSIGIYYYENYKRTQKNKV